MIRTAAILALTMIAAPLAAMDETRDYPSDVVNPDYELAKSAMLVGAARARAPQTQEDWMVCAAHWEGLFRMQRGAFVTMEDEAALGPEVDKVDAKAASVHFLDAFGEMDDAQWEQFQTQAASAANEVVGFRAGNRQATKRFFKELGWCKIRSADDE